MKLPLVALILFPLLGSCSPAPASENNILTIEDVARAGLKFNWRNLTCPTCKALFVILDIALLVMLFLSTLNLGVIVI